MANLWNPSEDPIGEPPPRLRPIRSPSNRGLPAHSRIFVNRNFRMSSVRAVGFDLDYTLAHYCLWEIDDLAFRLTKEKLVRKRNHSEEILSIPFDPEFVRRGLVIDRRRGNILKMDYHNYVVRAFHGRNPLTAEDRKRIYHMRRIRLSSRAYVSVDTLFHLPEVYLYLALVDFYEERSERVDFRELYQDVRDMIDEAHADGSIKGEIQKDPERFVTPDPRLGEFLGALRDAGKKVFLLTNSEYYYTEVLLSYLLEGPGLPGWRTHFDLVAVESCKPAFFLERNRPGHFLVQSGPGAPVFCSGDVWKLEELLGVAGDKILYWGDHTYGDILRSKKNMGWRTAMIIPELEHELTITESIAPDLERLDEAIQARDRIDLEEQIARLEIDRLETLSSSEELTEEKRARVHQKIERVRHRLAAIRKERDRERRLIAELDEACSLNYNRYWGMLFREANEISRFGHQVKDFACIYTSRVSNFLNYPMDTYFRAPTERLPHER